MKDTDIIATAESILVATMMRDGTATMVIGVGDRQAEVNGTGILATAQVRAQGMKAAVVAIGLFVYRPTGTRARAGLGVVIMVQVQKRQEQT